MIRRVWKTFDWEYLVRCLAVLSALYVLGTAAAHHGLTLGAHRGDMLARRAN